MENIKISLSNQLENDLTSQKERLVRLKKSAKKEQSLAQKVNYFKRIGDAESILRQMRLNIFSAEDAGEQAILRHDISLFDQFGMFSGTHQWIKNEIKKTDQQGQH